MDPRLQRRVQRYGWDKAAAFYEQYWAAQLLPAQDRLMAFAALQPGERVLDVACGSGLVTFRAATAVQPGGSVLATDISEAMVTIVRQRAERDAWAHVAAERMDGEELRVGDATFDVALCALGLMYMPEPEGALREMYRALRPGGRAVVAIWGARRECGWAEIFSIVDKRVQSEVCPLFFRLGGDDALSMVMQGAGFADVTVERMATTLHYDSTSDACGAAFAGGPVALAYARFDEATRAEVHAEYIASVAAYAHGEVLDVPGTFVIARGVRPAGG